MTRKSPIVGIDLGTTYSLVALLQAGKPVVLPNAIGELLTPSAVSVTDDGTVLVGAPARARAATHPVDTSLAFKRDMGTERVHTLRGKTFRPQELSALVLGALKRDAEVTLGVPIEEAVITVPAYFGEQQRAATRDAGEIAGFRVERIINEPTAAALAYGLHARQREMRCVVLDLGGGTFDVSILEILEGMIEIQSSAGDARLGGEDFTDALADVAVRRMKQDLSVDVAGEPVALARIREACESAKKRLGESTTARLAFPELPIGGGKTRSIELVLAREEAETAWAPLMDRLRVPIQRALADAGKKASEIDEVLLVGGATRMPPVGKLAAQLFARLPLRALPPDEAVALGAAVQAALKEGDAAVGDLVATDVAPFTLGIETTSMHSHRRVGGLYAPIIERGTVIPTSRIERFYTIGDDQTQIDVNVHQGEHSLVKDNTFLGKLIATGIPPARAGRESIDVRFSYDLNGLLEVEVTIVSTGRIDSLVIERAPGRMTPAQIAAAREAMKGLKLHPRDALPNTTALARADALYAELSGEARERLGICIAELRAALETQQSIAIERAREVLIAATLAFQRARDEERS